MTDGTAGVAEARTILERARKQSANTPESVKLFNCEFCGAPVREGSTCSNSTCRNKAATLADASKALKGMSVPPLYFEARKIDYSAKRTEVVERLAALEHGGVFIHGPQGTGKTHLAAAILAERAAMLACETGWDGLWISAPDLLAEIRATYNARSPRTEQEVKRDYMRVGALVLDDIGAEKVTDWSMSSMYSILSHRINYMKFTVVTSNLTIPQIHEWEPRIASRLGGFRVIALDGPDRRIQK